MHVEDLELEDYHDFVNAILDGPSEEAVASFHIKWSSSKDKHRFHDTANEFDANVVYNSAIAEWSATGETSMYVSDPASTSFSLFAEVGHERNGVYFS